METASIPTRPLSNLTRLALSAILAAACLGAMWLAIEMGLARILAGYGLLTSDLAPVDQALRLSPADPEARVNRAFLLSQRGEFAAAAAELERAAQLRPRDYYLWLELGMARDQSGDAAGAERAFRESARLAPYYAQPPWQLGNFLFRQGRHDEALRELHRAARSDPTHLPHIIGLAWAALGDAEAVRKVLQPQSAYEHIALAKFFARKGNGKEAAAEFLRAGTTSADDRRDLIVQLMTQKEFDAAYEIWAEGRDAAANATGADRSRVHDGGFEAPLEIKDPGFGWRVSQDNPAINLSLDAANPHQGGKSLRLEFRGAPGPQTPAISQLIRVQPETRYRLQFAARTQELVSGGLPFVAIGDAVVPAVMFAESQLFPGGSAPWSEYVVDFTTGKETHAVLLQLRRKPCTTEPCPIFGLLWLDSFSLRPGV